MEQSVSFMLNYTFKAKTDSAVGLPSYSHDYAFIVSGSEDNYVYIWSTYHDLSKFTSVRRDRNDFWEGIKGTLSVLNDKQNFNISV